MNVCVVCFIACGCVSLHKCTSVYVHVRVSACLDQSFSIFGACLDKSQSCVFVFESAGTNSSFVELGDFQLTNKECKRSVWLSLCQKPLVFLCEHLFRSLLNPEL